MCETRSAAALRARGRALVDPLRTRPLSRLALSDSLRSGFVADTDDRDDGREERLPRADLPRYGLVNVGSSSAFQVGDRVLVAGGYDMEPPWLAGGSGYSGRIEEIYGHRSAVRLDRTLSLSAPGDGWSDFGNAARQPITKVANATGEWLALALADHGAHWTGEVTRLHVSVCRERPDLEVVPAGGGVGVWVESHAAIAHL